MTKVGPDWIVKHAKIEYGPFLSHKFAFALAELITDKNTQKDCI